MQVFLKGVTTTECIYRSNKAKSPNELMVLQKQTNDIFVESNHNFFRIHASVKQPSNTITVTSS